MASLSHELGIDLGTLNTRIVEGKDILLQEPTIVAILLDELKLVEIGKSALNMMGRVPENIEVIRPMRFGVIAEYEITENFLREMVRMVTGRMLLFRPKLMITVPFGITSVERRAVYEAGLGAGSRDVYLIQQPLAGAIGIDLPIGAPTGNMIICLGGGTSQAAVLAMHSLVSAETSRVAGLELDEAIISFVRRKFGLIIGQPTAEQLKIQIGAALPKDNPQSMQIQGQDQVSGLPRPATITTDDIVEALQTPLENIAGTIRRVLEKTPPELISDIIDRGVALCGGTALLAGIDRYLTASLGIPAYLVDNPTTCVAEGASRAFSMIDVLSRSLPSKT
ncbi:MAG TPA: rod shape-determining protein [Brevefilum fermentans]|uniref:Cell shape-determining protein MreB n=1 Tax=Candidatus Brevifilum fermentans TaxID=1986204 RepID=A0A1Y6K4U0_9CHLR|nr:rod shape-determining protein [Brevefilum fermentans]MDI9567111.1 rod shape-determining protein [Chloroflexota bacterium]OQB86363.1 MAG: Rod shape-determining protein MreB [Chloroflexi bacterium ADurb.Bin120]SMX54644.1 Rod shape-determining protein MreB [Brevefilum fermentans]HOM66954.1 rod shape-determining protein [Brevefilum fermentans]HPX96045.1 rod shape-determining protein [Brevefilum fermentans]